MAATLREQHLRVNIVDYSVMNQMFHVPFQYLAYADT